MTDQMVQHAIVSCAKDRFAGNVQGTLQALRQGRCEICFVYTDHLISQLGNFIGDVDRTVKAVYKIKPYGFDSNNASEDFKHQKAATTPPQTVPPLQRIDSADLPQNSPWGSAFSTASDHP